MAYPPRFQMYRAADGWRWRFRAAGNGEIIASGEAYATKEDCRHVLWLLRAQAPIAEIEEVAPAPRRPGLLGSWGR